MQVFSNYEVVEHAWIPIQDGVRLAARLWIPKSAYQDPVPAIFEYMPYRLRDSCRLRDERMFNFFANNGYAGIRVDIRGSGDSEGLLTDEYLASELQDGLKVMQWLEEQPWCNGKIGMIGISWGGFNSLQIAALNPPQLKAIITACSTDDRYTDDIHYMGGCLLGDNISWSSAMFSYNSCPPDPQIVGESWREMWKQRLEKSGHWLIPWLNHQHRDEYWQHGSVCENYQDIKCPVMAIGGWADGYSNAVFRLIEKLSVPRLGLLGPWGHQFPHEGVPGPAVGFLQEATRWWDKWLKEKPNGIDHEPKLRAWMQDSHPPRSREEYRPGRWVAVDTWPTENAQTKKLSLTKEGLLKPVQSCVIDDSKLSVDSPLASGLHGGKWFSYAGSPDLADDQRWDDGGALCFESEPASSPLEIFGFPEVTLTLQADQPSALVAVRLVDVFPSGAASRITYGVLNLTHRNSSAQPEPLEPGKTYRVSIKLNGIAHSLKPGHRLRVAVSSSYWPLVWPSPKKVEIKIFPTQSFISLPLWDEKKNSSKDVEFTQPEKTTASSFQRFREPERNRIVSHDLGKQTTTLEVINDAGGITLEDINLSFSRLAKETYTCKDDDPLSARAEVYSERTFKRDSWMVKTEGKTVLSCDEKYFYLNAELKAFEGDKCVFSKTWKESFTRPFI